MAAKVCASAPPQGHAHIPRRLVHHQHALHVLRAQHAYGQIRCVVVFAQPCLQQLGTRPAYRLGIWLQHIGSASQQTLQSTGPGAVVINAGIVHHQRQRREMIARTERAQKAIFQRQVRQLMLASIGLRLARAGAQPPARYRVNYRKTPNANLPYSSANQRRQKWKACNP